MTLNMLIATGAWVSLMLGYLARRRRRVHVPLVLTGILADISLVLYLQVTRDAVQKALSFSLTLFQQIHIGVSTAALILYLPTLYFGWRLLRGDRSVLAWHIRIASAALLLRTLGFLFMFSMWKG